MTRTVVVLCASGQQDTRTFYGNGVNRIGASVADDLKQLCGNPDPPSIDHVTDFLLRMHMKRNDAYTAAGALLNCDDGIYVNWYENKPTVNVVWGCSDD